MERYSSARQKTLGKRIADKVLETLPIKKGEIKELIII